MNHKGTVRLETDRLILRRFVIEDAEAMYRNWASIGEVTEFLTWPAHSSVDVSKKVLSSWISQYEDSAFYNWAIELKEAGEVIGNISVVRMNDGVRSAELGYCLGNRWWGKGVMTEAAGAVLKFLFNEAGFNRIAATHAGENPKSGRVMQKIGMQYEGTLRQAGRCNQGIVDEVWYSVLREEYLRR